MIRISVIIPIFNVERYLENTLNSLLNQTMVNDIEVIMVDDGSTDYSSHIIDEYDKKYDNFHAYHKKHQGQAIARNFGLEIAQGVYIHFMDADDYLPPKAYENLYYFNPHNDFVVGNVLKFGEYNIWENVLFKQAFKYFSGDVQSFKLSDCPQVLWDTISCNKLLKKEFLDRHNIRFISRDTYYEDLLFTLQCYYYAESIGFSSNIFYYWRLRKDKSSITQKTDDVKNFLDRLEILKIYYGLMEKLNFNDDITDVVYDKWLNHDLRTSLKKIGNYPGKYYKRLIDETSLILNVIPVHLKRNLNSYLKILYKMVENRDIDSLISFAHLEDEFKENPNMELDIPDVYLNYIDLDCNEVENEFSARVSNVYGDENNLFIEFSENLSFVPQNYPHNILAFLLNKNDVIQLTVQNNLIVLPLNLISSLNHLKIKLTYSSTSFNKSVLLRNYRRQSIRFNDFDVDLGIGINNILYLDIYHRRDNNIIIRNVSLEDGEFTFVCESLKPVQNMLLTNYVTYRKISYPIIPSGDGTRFIFKIPFNNLSNDVIKRYELNSPQSFNSIKLILEIKFIYENCEILFKNRRNKIYIINQTVDQKNIEVKKLKSENKKLIKENNKLYQTNSELNNKIEEFKSRKAVKFIDNIQGFFNR